MKIKIYTNGMGIADSDILMPGYKTQIQVCGQNVREGILTLDFGFTQRAFSVVDGVANISRDAWVGGKLSITYTATKARPVKIYNCGSYRRTSEGSGYVAEVFSGREALMAAFDECEAVRTELAKVLKELKTVKETLSSKFIVGGK